jgi:hypothetical protein
MRENALVPGANVIIFNVVVGVVILLHHHHMVGQHHAHAKT